MAYDKDLPDELQEGQDTPVHSADREDRLEALGKIIAEKRDEAIKARKDSGIEDIWTACEEAYLCIDDSNRSMFKGAKWIKPTSVDGPVTVAGSGSSEGKSTAYVRLTARYVDAGKAKVCEMALPINDKAFSFGPSPVPELIAAKEDLSQVIDSDGTPLEKAPTPTDLAAVPPGQPAPQAVPLTVKDLAEEKLNEAKTKAEKAEKRIYDWMVESNYPAQMRKVIFDSARIGTGVLKGPFPDIKKSMALTKQQDGPMLEIAEEVKPISKWIDVWNCFPDPSCGENIHDGDHFLERDFLTAKKLKDLKRQRNKDGARLYLDTQIDKVIDEGPGKCNTEGRNPNEKKNDKQFEIWYYYGILSKEDMIAAGAIGIEDLPSELTDVYAIVSLVNDTVIRVNVNPLDSGNFPFRVMPWSRRAGHWTGVGVGEQVNLPQNMVNAATRALLNNGGLSAGIQLIIDQFKLEPADQKWVITPNKIWRTADGAALDDVRKAMMTIEFPNVGDAMMAIINYAFKLAEEATNIPLISQGQTDKNTPETFGATELQNSNAHTLLRDIAYTLDDNVTEPLVRDYYEWLLMDPSVPNDEKGDFQINARGSVSLVEKAIQEQFLIQQGNLVLNPVFGIDPEKWYAEVMVSKRLDPRKIQYTDEKKKEMAAKPPPEPPVVTAAKIRAESAEKVAQSHDSATVAKSKADTDRDTVYVNAEAQRTQIEHEARMAELSLRRELAILEMANKKDLTVEQIKSDLARDVMKLNTQVKLAGADGHGPQVATPPTEPPGRAPNGEAYQA